MPAQKPLPVGRGRKPGTKLAYKPQTESEKAKRLHLPPPVTAEDKAAKDVQQTARVEMLLLKGVTSPRLLGSMLGIDSERDVNRYISLVHARWTVTGSARDLKKSRGEALARLAMVEQEVWSRFSDNGEMKPSDRTAAYKLLLEIQDQRNMLLGLQPRTLEKLVMLPESSGLMTGKLAAQASLGAVAERFLEIMAARRGALGPQTIEHASEDFSDDAETSH